jgi:GAF domain-containing protein
MDSKPSDENRNIAELLVEIDSLRHQIEHLRNGNQLAIIAKERREAEIGALMAIGQAAAVETDLSKLLFVIHREVVRVLGDLDLNLAIYNEDKDLIEFPYAIENGEFSYVEPLPLGENLVSTILNEQRPIILSQPNDDTEQCLILDNHLTKVKSWMGVPLIIGDETIGVMIVKDSNKVNQFNQHDQQILLTIANQIAANIRYLRMIEVIRQKAEYELLVAEISRKISVSTSIESVLRTAVKELGQHFGASNTQIILDISSESSLRKSNGAG